MSATKRSHCNSRGWIARETFLAHMQRTSFKVKKSTGRVLCDTVQVLPCALEELAVRKIGLLCLHLRLSRQLCIISSPNRRSQCGETSNEILYYQ